MSDMFRFRSSGVGAGMLPAVDVLTGSSMHRRLQRVGRGLRIREERRNLGACRRCGPDRDAVAEPAGRDAASVVRGSLRRRRGASPRTRSVDRRRGLALPAPSTLTASTGISAALVSARPSQPAPVSVESDRPTVDASGSTRAAGTVDATLQRGDLADRQPGDRRGEAVAADRERHRRGRHPARSRRLTPGPGVAAGNRDGRRPQRHAEAFGDLRQLRVFHHVDDLATARRPQQQRDRHDGDDRAQAEQRPGRRVHPARPHLDLGRHGDRTGRVRSHDHQGQAGVATIGRRPFQLTVGAARGPESLRRRRSARRPADRPTAGAVDGATPGTFCTATSTPPAPMCSAVTRANGDRAEVGLHGRGRRQADEGRAAERLRVDPHRGARPAGERGPGSDQRVDVGHDDRVARRGQAGRRRRRTHRRTLRAA